MVSKPTPGGKGDSGGQIVAGLAIEDDPMIGAPVGIGMPVMPGMPANNSNPSAPQAAAPA